MTTHAWLSGAKKASLAPVVVATIDRLLLAGPKPRHVALGHLAGAGKVVVIDEVHACDCYMSCDLDRFCRGWVLIACRRFCFRRRCRRYEGPN
jgi:hypothetical protein